jgi:hypothetical protein
MAHLVNVAQDWPTHVAAMKRQKRGMGEKHEIASDFKSWAQAMMFPNFNVLART